MTAVALVLLLWTGAGCTESPVDTPEPEPAPEEPAPKDPDPDPDPDPTPPKQSADVEIDKWMYEYMQTHYLWNHAVKAVTPDYSLDYEPFLEDILLKVAAQNDINHDDGHWENGRRTSFYSNVSRYRMVLSATTRFDLNRMITSYGFEMLYVTQLTNTTYGFLVADVNPNGPAYKAGIRRGDIIMKVNGSTVSSANMERWWSSLFYDESGSVELTLLDIPAYFNNKIQDGSVVSVATARFEDNPVLLAKVIPTDDGRKVGYLNYATFNNNYDQALIDAFATFASEGIDELVLDLRYNGGGHVVSSAVLGTLVAGAAHKGEVYSKTSYNEDRKDETVDIYRIGEASYNSGNPAYRYAPISSALNSAVGLSRIYVLGTSSTASASELVINGLRGLDIEVRLIGERTNGKNVGMEPIARTFGDYRYEFSPITFYSVNAKDFNDYSDGFAPDLASEEYFYYQSKRGTIAKGELGNPDLDSLLADAMEWITTGQKPAATRSRAQLAPFALPVRTLGTNPRHPSHALRLPAAEE